MCLRNGAGNVQPKPQARPVAWHRPLLHRIENVHNTSPSTRRQLGRQLPIEGPQMDAAASSLVVACRSGLPSSRRQPSEASSSRDHAMLLRLHEVRIEPCIDRGFLSCVCPQPVTGINSRRAPEGVAHICRATSAHPVALPHRLYCLPAQPSLQASGQAGSVACQTD